MGIGTGQNGMGNHQELPIPVAGSIRGQRSPPERPEDKYGHSAQRPGFKSDP